MNPSTPRALALVLLVGTLSCSETRQHFPDSGQVDPGPAPDAAGPATDSAVPAPGDAVAPSDVPEDTLDAEPGDSDEPGDLPSEVDTSAPPVVEPLPPRTCERTFTYTPIGESPSAIALAGEFNGWSATAQPLQDGDGDGTWETTLATDGLAGSHGYKFVVTVAGSEDWRLDPKNPMQKHVDGTPNSKVLIQDCKVPLLVLESLETGADTLTAVIAVRQGAAADGLGDATAVVRHGFSALPSSVWNAESQRFVVSLNGLAPGKHSLNVGISGPGGQAAPLYLPIWLEATPFDWSDAVLYFTMTDRFADGDPGASSPDPCLPADSKANWLGGDWPGITAKIKAGYFATMGVNTLWLSPVNDNPDGCFFGQLGKQYTSYHAYFPKSLLAPEARFGTLDQLRELVAAAHASGMRVIVDLVANHTHSEHPDFTAHPEWFNPYYACGFEEAPLTCWFETYTPDLKYEQDGAVEAISEMALWWIREADLDGFRVDAVKHMHDNFVLTLRHKIATRIETTPGASFWMVGETFAGDWGGGSGPNETVIKKYIGADWLTGQFDFPLYWRILRVFARDQQPPLHIADLLTAAQGHYGPGAVMSNFLGNHDIPRFASHANGDIGDEWGNGSKEQGWDNPPPQPANAEPYQRLGLAFSLLFTIRGVPLIYYGDEIGLAGAGDPDNRRMMSFDGWNAHQKALVDHIGALASVRAGHPALRRGTYKTLLTNDSLLAFEQSDASEALIVALNRSGAAQTAKVPAAAGAWTELLSGESVEATSGTLELAVEPWGTRILKKN